MQLVFQYYIYLLSIIFEYTPAFSIRLFTNPIMEIMNIKDVLVTKYCDKVLSVG